MTREEMLIARSKTGVSILRVVDTPKGELWRGAETLRLISHPKWVDRE
jgi:hypothetical protein